MAVRRLVRAAVLGALVGAVSVGVGWAGAGLAPPTGAPAEPPRIEALVDGGLLAGASRISLEPRPEDYGGTWQTEGCETMGGDAGSETFTHLENVEHSPWPASPDCIYMGGYGIGPMHAITSWDEEYGLWVRSVALGDGTTTVVLTSIDAVYYMGRYGRMCRDCGAFDIAARLGDELGIDPAGFFIAASHSHTGPDLIGGWGGVPDWYMAQVQDAIEGSIRAAVGAMEPAAVEVGEELARGFNRERRNTYRSAEEPGLSWVRVVAPDARQDRGRGRPGSRASEGRVIATVGAFAAHPTTVDPEPGVAHADWPGVFVTRLEERFGGVGLHFMTGLGNMSARGGTLMGRDLADLVPDPGEGRLLEDASIRVAAEEWDQPVTNAVLGGLATPGFFDRPFDFGPAEVSAGKHAVNRCRSAAPVSVRTQVNVAAIGDLFITGAPGETFSNLSNTLKEANPTGVTLPLGMVNDGLGYIMQSFESDHAARQGTGFVGGPAGIEYEDAYSIDACFGDVVLETTLALMDAVR
jgi:hypothetical protein